MKVQGAHSYRLGICSDPECTALHFELLDVHGRAFAHMTIGIEHVERVTERMRELVADMSKLKEEMRRGNKDHRT